MWRLGDFIVVFNDAWSLSKLLITTNVAFRPSILGKKKKLLALQCEVQVFKAGNFKRKAKKAFVVDVNLWRFY